MNQSKVGLGLSLTVLSILLGPAVKAAADQWLEPLCTTQSYPVLGSPTGWWEEEGDDGTSYVPDDFSILGHSCGWQEGATEGCGDGVCSSSEGFDPTTCWEDCVETQWVDSDGQVQILRDRILFFGSGTVEHWLRDDNGKDVFLMTDLGYQAQEDDPLYTGKNGCGSQLLWVRRDGDLESGACVERRFRGKTLSQGLLTWTHSAEKTHDGHILVTDTNASVILKLEAETGKEIWRLDGLHYSAEASDVYCNAGSTEQCCTTGGCNEPFAPHIADDTSGGISYQNMAREIYDPASGKVRYVLSNRSMETLAILDAESATNSAPSMVPVASEYGTKFYGEVSWAFGFNDQMATSGTDQDLCTLSWPHGVRYVDYGYGNIALFSADLLGNRVVRIPYNHDCYSTSPTNVATVLESNTPSARAVDPAGPLLFTQNDATYTTQDPNQSNGSPSLYLGDSRATSALSSAAFPFDMRRFRVEGDPKNYILYSGPLCGTPAGDGEAAKQSRYLVLSLWTEQAGDPTLNFEWTYPNPATYPLACSGEVSSAATTQ